MKCSKEIHFSSKEYNNKIFYKVLKELRNILDNKNKGNYQFVCFIFQPDF